MLMIQFIGFKYIYNSIISYMYYLSVESQHKKLKSSE